MITAYHRPASIEEALELIRRPSPKTVALGGGTLLSHGQPEPIEVVDLQALGLGHVRKRGKNLEVGATVTLQQLLEDGNCPSALRSALKLEAPLNLRNAATVAGSLVVCDGRSTFATVLLALDTKLHMLRPAPQSVDLGEFLPLRSQMLPRTLITGTEFRADIKLAFEYVSRTPADRPIVGIALARWPSGRTRLAAGGYGAVPMLAMDGTESAGIEAAAQNAFHDAVDERGSAEYRMDVAATLARRCLALLEA